MAKRMSSRAIGGLSRIPKTIRGDADAIYDYMLKVSPKPNITESEKQLLYAAIKIMCNLMPLEHWMKLPDDSWQNLK